MNSLSVLFRDGSSSSYFSRKLFEFWAYVNSLDHLDCSHGALAVFYNNFLISGSKFFPLPKKSWNFGMCKFSKLGFTLRFSFVMEIYLPVSRGSCSNFELLLILFIIWIAVMVHWQYFKLNLILGSKFLPLSTSCWNFCMSKFSW